MVHHHGVTGSGKTQVYIRLIREALDRGQGAILLVPEIALTPQMVWQFCLHFRGQVEVVHSALTAAQRLEAFRRIRAGKTRVVIGTRTAVFAPVAAPGVIILDEEQEHSYKSADSDPRYHARDVAKYRAAHAAAAPAAALRRQQPPPRLMRDARRVALDALIAFRREGSWPDLYLKKASAPLPREEAALAAALTYGVLENRALLDFWIGACSSVPLRRMTPPVPDILRLALYQLVFMKAMNPVLSKRYSSAAELLEDLEDFRNDLKIDVDIPSAMLGENTEGFDGYDVEKAKQYLKDSGVDPSTVKLEMICSNDTKRRAASVIQANLKDVLGIDSEIVSMPLTTSPSPSTAARRSAWSANPAAASPRRAAPFSA